MSGRSYEVAADEFETLGFEPMVREFALNFAELSQGELMAMRSRFVHMAAGDGVEARDQRQSCYVVAAALDEVLVYRLRGNEAGLCAYLDAKHAELELLKRA